MDAKQVAVLSLEIRSKVKECEGQARPEVTKPFFRYFIEVSVTEEELVNDLALQADSEA